ncbi:MAG: hypothetical protein K2Y37_12240 [Pirellulales bacterium]|nr:hypothetical protein [Pirellulales bacterium]
MRDCRLLLAAALGVLGYCAGSGDGFGIRVVAADRITVVVGTDPPRLERFAAEELARQFKQLFACEMAIVEAGSDGAAVDATAVLVGNPQTNSEVRKVVGDAWPKLSDQGFVIRSIERDGQPVLVVGGDRPVATLWAAYELGQQFGVRYLLTGDVYPAEAPKLRLSGFDFVAEPELRTRAWQAIDDLPIGSSAWGLDEHRRVLGQLAKLKFNRVILNVYPWQPFVDFEIDGTRKTTAELFYGWKFLIDGDTAGRAAFKGAHEFTNPDLAGKSSPAERVAAGKLLINGIIATAHELGMTVGLCVSPLEFPPEFASLLPGAEPCGPEKLTVGPGSQQIPHDERVRQPAAAQVQAFVATYPQIDAIYLSPPRVATWTGYALTAWERMLRQIATERRSALDELLDRVKSIRAGGAGEAAVARVKTQLAAIDALDRLPIEGVLERPDGSRREAQVAGIDPALAAVLARIESLHVGMLLGFGDSAQRAAEVEAWFEELPDGAKDEAAGPEANPKCLVLPLAADGAGALPQTAAMSLQKLITDLTKHGWSGYAVSSRMPGDLDYQLQFLSRAAWKSGAAPDAALEELVTPMCGPGVTARVALAFSQLEQATALIDEQDAGFAAVAPDMVIKHYAAAEAPPERWQKLQDLYVVAMNEMYRAHDRSHPRGRPYLRYYCKRLEFAVEYVGSVQALRRAGAAKKSADQETLIAELEKAIESMYNALSALSEVARDSGDRGAIAMLNAWGYRPLQQALADADAQ